MSYYNCELLQMDKYTINDIKTHQETTGKQITSKEICVKFFDTNTVLTRVENKIVDIKGIYYIIDGIDKLETHILLENGTVIVVKIDDEKCMYMDPTEPFEPSKQVDIINGLNISELLVEEKDDPEHEEYKIFKINYYSNVVHSGESSEVESSDNSDESDESDTLDLSDIEDQLNFIPELMNNYCTEFPNYAWSRYGPIRKDEHFDSSIYYKKILDTIDLYTKFIIFESPIAKGTQSEDERYYIVGICIN